MSRINIYEQIDHDTEWMRRDETPALLGHFDPDKAERFEQGSRWDGSNTVGVITGSQWVDEYLYRTSGGKWVLNHDAHRCHNGPDTYAFLTDEQAHDWLLRSECNDEAIKRFFGPVPEEADRRPGRPAIGDPIQIRLHPELLASVDWYAGKAGVPRAEAARRLLQRAVTRVTTNDEDLMTIELAGLTAVRIDRASRVIAIDNISGTGADDGPLGPEWTVRDLRDGTIGDFHRLRPASQCAFVDCAASEHVGTSPDGGDK